MAKVPNPNALTLDDLKSLIPQRPIYSVPLPSRGLFYDKAVVPAGEVELLPMSAREEKMVAGIKGNNLDEVIDAILQRCLVTKISPNDLLVTDRFFLLLMLRANSYGEKYTYELDCPNCEKKAKYTTLLPSDLEIKYPKEGMTEPFVVTLPETNIRIGVRMQRGSDQRAIRKYIAGRKGITELGDPAYFFSTALAVATVNEKTADNNVAMALLEQLPAKDMLILREFIDDVTPGVLTAIKKTCASCDFSIEVDLPITAEFFRPRFTTIEKSV